MTVFKTFFRLLRKNISNIVFPLILFIVISFAITLSTQTQTNEFKKIEPVVVLINRGEETVITTGLRTYIDTTMDLLELDEQFIEDSIFYRQADFVAIIQEDGTLDFEMIYDANFGYLAKQNINQFFANFDLYQKHQPHLSEEEIVEYVLLDAQESLSVVKYQSSTENDFFVSRYFNAQTYIIMLLIFGVIGKNLLSFNRQILVSRANVSSLSPKKHGVQLFLSSLLTLHILWLIVCAVTFLLISKKLDHVNVSAYLLNMYIFSWSVLGMSFLISRLVSTENGLSAMTTGLSLGLAFISGAFVPQIVLSNPILAIAKISPVYWAIAVNDMLNLGAGINEVVMPLLIQCAFAITMVILALLVSKQKKMNVKDLS